MKDQEASIRIAGRWDIPYEYAAGTTATHFFQTLKEHQRILGRRCPHCRRVLVPPRAFCERCFVWTDDWVEVGPKGTVETFTVTYEAFAGLRKPPYVIGLIKLDGASTKLAHFIGELDAVEPGALLARVKAGLRVEAVFLTERRGSILDIEYFRPVDRGMTA